ncbi:hypothetical protein ROZALSC1DRAFT_28470, partial [Rozella allomycis CSF55]
MFSALLPLILVFGTIQVSKYFNLDTPENLTTIRAVYTIAQFLVFSVFALIYFKVKKNVDKAVVMYTPPPEPFGETKKETVKMSIQEYDTMELKQNLRQASISVAILAFLHVKFGYTQPLIIQSVLPIFNLIKSPLFKIYFLGKSASGELRRPWKVASNPMFENMKKSLEQETKKSEKSTHRGYHSFMVVTSFPERLDFPHYEPSQRIQRNVTITNRHSKSIRLAIEAPSCKHFKIVDSTLKFITDPVFLAPGMELTLIVEFNAPKKASIISNKDALQFDENLLHFIGEERSPEINQEIKREKHDSPNLFNQDDEVQLDESENAYKDSITIEIIGMKKTLTIPLNATPSVAKVEMISSLNFGNIVWHDESQKPVLERNVVINNVGEKPCFVQFSDYDDEIMTVSPRTFFLEGHQFATNANHVTNVKIKIDPEMIELLNMPLRAEIFTVRPLYDSPMKPFVANDKYTKVLNIKANVTRQSVRLSTKIGDDLVYAECRFGEMFAGEKRDMHVKFVNHGPLHARCSLGSTEKLSCEVIEEDVIIFSKDKFLVPGNSEVNISVTVKSKKNKNRHGFQNKLVLQSPRELKMKYTFAIELMNNVGEDCEVFPEFEQTIMAEPLEIDCVATINPIDVSLSVKELEFGQCYMRNQSSKLPVRYEIAQFPNFKFSVNQNVIERGGFEEINVLFFPRQLGDCSFNLPIKVLTVDNQYLCTLYLRINALCVAKVTENGDMQLSSMNSVYGSMWKVPSYYADKNEDKFLDKYLKRHPESTRGVRSSKERNIIERKQLNINREKHIKYIRNHRNKRISEKRSNIVFNDKSFKMKDLLNLDEIEEKNYDPINGLNAPDIDLEEVLRDLKFDTNASNYKELDNFNNNSIDNMANTNLKPGSLAPIHSSNPISEKQRQECQKPIVPSELSKINCLTQQIEFGTIILNSKKSFNLNFINGSRNAIKIELEFPKNNPSFEIECENSLIQYVPKKNAAGFVINFTGKITGSFLEQMSYKINDKYQSNIKLLAHVIPLSLELSTKEIRFEDLTGRLHKGEITRRKDFYQEEVLILKNNHKVYANFVWSKSNSINYKDAMSESKNMKEECLIFESPEYFSINPRFGVIEPNSSLNIKVRFIPGSRQKIDEVWYLLVENGDRLSISCHAIVTPTTCVVNIKDIEYGMIPVYMHDKDNEDEGDNAALENCVTDHSIVSTFTTFERIIKLRNTGTLDTFFYIPKGQVTIEPHEGLLAAGGIIDLTCRVLPSKPGKFHETTQIFYLGTRGLRLGITYLAVEPHVVVSFCDLMFKEPVYVGNSSRKNFTLINNELVQAQLHLDLNKYESFSIEETENIETVLDISKKTNGMKGSSHLKSNLIKSNKFYSIIVQPKSSLTLTLIYAPIKEDEINEFKLPLKSISDNDSNLTLTSQWNKVIYWRIVYLDNINNSNNSFRFSSLVGSLSFGVSTSIKITFRPTKLGLSTADFMIEAIDMNDKVISSTLLNLQGMGVEPANELNFKSPPDSQPINLTLSFPQGKKLKSNGERLIVFIKSKSNKPISFNTFIDFVTGNGSSFRRDDGRMIGVNELENIKRYGLSIKEESNNKSKNISSNENVSVRNNDNLCADLENLSFSKLKKYYKFISSPAGLCLSNGSVDYSLLIKISNMLVSWFTDVFVLNTQITEFPNSFIQQNGKPIFDLVQILGGKKNLPISFKTPSGTAEERLIQMERQYLAILNYLCTRGALLGSIKPEYLFSLQDYKKWNQMRIHNMKSQTAVSDEFISYLSTFEANFDIISREAWITLVFQIIKVFLMERITPKQLKNIVDAQVDISTATNKIFSTNELTLLKWNSFEYHKLTKKYAKITDFEDCFKDSVYIGCLLQCFISQLEINDFNYNVTSEAMRNKNANLVSQTLQNILPGFRFSADRIMKPFAYDIILLLTYLFLVLPEFIPKDDILHEKITKYIEINNPTNKSLTFLVQLEGAPEFSIKEITVTVPSKSNVKYAIDYFSRFSRTAKAQITLKSSKMTLETASVLVFNLTSDVEKPHPKQIFEIEGKLIQGPLYSHPPTTIQLEIKNPFPMRGKFSIQLKTFKVVTKSVQSAQKDWRGKKNSSSVDLVQVLEESSSTDTIPPAFRIPFTEIVLEGDGMAKLPIAFCPFTLGNHEATLYFVDENVGEFLYQVKGKATIPVPSETFQYTCKCENKLEKSLRISFNSLNREKAVNNYLLNPKVKVSKKENQQIAALRELYSLPEEATRYKVEYSNSYFKGPTEINLEENQSLTSFNESATYFELSVTFEPK